MKIPASASRLYQLALRAFPRRHRDVYAAEMLDAFERELRHTGHDRRARGRFVAAACLNVAGMGLVRAPSSTPAAPRAAFSTLDFTLAWRMLIRYPGLSIVSVLGMTVGIAIAAGAFTVIGAMTNAELPLPDGDGVVSVVNWDASTSNRELRMLRDFSEWRGITSIEDLSITRTVQRNLIVDGHQPETVTVAEISASAFRVARVAAFRGRYLLPEDERPDAASAILIGHDEWVRRFGADPEIVGRSVQLGQHAPTRLSA